MTYLTVLSGEDTGRQIKLIPGRAITVGRHRDCDLRLTDESVSRRHFEVVWRSGEPFVVDLGSTHGTLINDTPVTEQPLRPGDRICVGGTWLKLWDELIRDRFDGMWTTQRDGLTRLLSKSAIRLDLINRIESAEVVGIVIANIRAFKMLNDRIGHLVGDKALIEVARILESAVSSHELVARIAGDEFLVVVSAQDEVVLERLADELVRLFDDTRLEATGSFVSLWTGTALYLPSQSPLTDVHDAECAWSELLRAARSRMDDQRRFARLH